MVGEGPSACADASEDSEALNETEGQGSYVLGLSPQRPLTNLVKESADRVRSSAVGMIETDEGPLSKANRSDSLWNFRLTPSFFFFKMKFRAFFLPPLPMPTPMPFALLTDPLCRVVIAFVILCEPQFPCI